MSKLRENITLNCVLPLAEKVVGTCASKWIKIIAEMSEWSPDDIRNWQEVQLRTFVRHAYDHTIYWHEVFDGLGLTPEDIQHIDDLKKLPVLTKEIVRARYNDLIADNASQYKHRKDHTGGTTGSPMNYLCDENVWGYVTAAKITYWRKLGYHYGDPFLALGSASIFEKKPSFKRRVYDKIRNEVARNSMNLDDQLCATYVKLIQKKHIRFIYGYAAALYVMADYVKRNNIDLPLKAVYATSENLTDHYRRTIESAFCCKVMDCYGSRDAGMTAYEVAPHCYQIGYNAITEIVDEVAPNVGTLISTNILNYSMPLLRYNFGDVAELATDVSQDEYNGQVLRQVMGRTSDIIRLDNGHVLTAPGFTILMLNFDVHAFQIQQKSGTEVIMMIQPKESFSDDDEERLLRELKRFAGEECNVSIQKVEKFEVNKNGKHRFFMNA